MRRSIAVATIAALVLGVLVAPASAGKPKKVHETFGATLLPFPKLAAWGDVVGLTKPGCSAGEQDVHWVAQEFTAPGKGTLRLWMEGFAGDHDIYIFDGETVVLRGENDQTGGAPAEEELLFPMKKRQTVTLVACNWLGQPDVLAHYEGIFK